jgi:poly(3-hydroxyalkanoate) synthetase
LPPFLSVRNRGEAFLDDGTPVDLMRIESPVIVFASHGDNITPTQQALNWIPDLYGSVKETEARGHVIIYTLHDSIGHLGIIVSAQVANRQHEQIGSVVKTIESLAPGLAGHHQRQALQHHAEHRSRFKASQELKSKKLDIAKH